MKLGPVDFAQPSTWRGILGLAAMGGWAISPELRDQIALALGTTLAAIEMFRNEYRGRSKSQTPTPTAQPTPDPVPTSVDAMAMRLRNQPTVRNTAEGQDASFGDR